MPGKSHGPRSLVGYNPWGRKESDTTERLLCVCVFSPSSPTSAIFCLFLIIAILTGVKWHLMVVVICISLIFSNVEHLFIHLLAIWMPSLEQCLFRSSIYIYIFLNQVIILLLLLIWDINLLLDIWFVNIFSHSVGYRFTDGFLHQGEAFNLTQSHLFIFQHL